MVGSFEAYTGNYKQDNMSVKLDVASLICKQCIHTLK